MVLAKSKNVVGLGNSLMNDRFGKGKSSDRKKSSHNAAIARKGPNGETYLTNAAKEASWVKMRSITEQAALDEFLSTAELAGTDFTAEKNNNIKIIHTDQKNPYLLSDAEERAAVRRQQKNKQRLTIPRRPKWNETTTPQELDAMEKESFLEWRRGLADLQENQDLLMTPFERNLEVWRQLWRVIERSDLVVQIVDARNSLLFRSEDLEKYVKEVDPRKENLLLVNKADLITLEQREAWADYFESNHINYRFFSAHLAKERIEAQLSEEDERSNSEREDADVELAEQTSNIKIDRGDKDNGAGSSEEELDDNDDDNDGDDDNDDDDDDEDDDDENDEKSEYDGRDNMKLVHENSPQQRTQILSVEELEELFLSSAPIPRTQSHDLEKAFQEKIMIGLVGYPNVGKSSTINAMLGAKKVSVSATPGKTKHFQTLYLSPNISLCDCPGLVFPNFATTKAELVVNGVLPIDQQREFTGPTALVAQRIPKHFLKAVYGMEIPTRPQEDGGTGVPTASEILRAYARARGFTTTGQGQPDESRAARYILKDYVNGKLLFCHPPPPLSLEEGPAIDPAEFNKKLYDLAHLPVKRRKVVREKVAVINNIGDGGDDVNSNDGDIPIPSAAKIKHPADGPRTRRLDQQFFGAGSSDSRTHLTMPFNHKYSEQGRQDSTGRKQKMLIALEKGIDVSEMTAIGNSKKHFKGGRKQKTRTKTKTSPDYDD
ncbi:hypothetical protein V8E54_000750 [Elaphomyces granulatus]|jgi:large subunit GTPase 1